MPQYAGAFAPYPSKGYPLDNFVGANGAKATADSPNAGGKAGGLGNAVPQFNGSHSAIAVVAIVLAGYIFWHYSQR